MAYNMVLDWTNIEVSYINGPVTVARAQAFCRVENTTAAQDVDFAMWVRAARTKIEQYTGLSLIPRTIVAILTNPQGNIELPFGPVTGTPAFVDTEGVSMTVETRGIKFLYIPEPLEYTKATYLAGYADGACPDELIEAMLLQICYWWENRGDETGVLGWSPQVITICQKWKR